MIRKTWAFTFGFGHRYPNSYIEMEDMTMGESRALMFEVYEKKWSFQYELDDKFKEDVKKYNLRLIRKFVREDLKEFNIEEEKE